MKKTAIAVMIIMSILAVCLGQCVQGARLEAQHGLASLPGPPAVTAASSGRMQDIATPTAAIPSSDAEQAISTLAALKIPSLGTWQAISTKPVKAITSSAIIPALIIYFSVFRPDTFRPDQTSFT